MPIQDIGIEQVFTDLRAEGEGVHGLALEVSNPTEYAAAVQDLEGYFVINDAILLATVNEGLADLVLSGQPLSAETARLALDRAGYDVVSYHRSLTGKTRPGIGAEERVQFTTSSGVRVDFIANRGASPADRKAHPGHWADDTGQLAGAYTHEVLP